MKTENIWVPTILHFLNNNLIAVLAGNISEEVIEGQDMYWSDLLPALLINGILFGIFLLAKEFRKEEPGNKFGKNSEMTMKTLAFVIRLTYNEVRKIK